MGGMKKKCHFFWISGDNSHIKGMAHSQNNPNTKTKTALAVMLLGFNDHRSTPAELNDAEEETIVEYLPTIVEEARELSLSSKFSRLVKPSELPDRELLIAAIKRRKFEVDEDILVAAQIGLIKHLAQKPVLERILRNWVKKVKVKSLTDSANDYLAKLSSPHKAAEDSEI